MLRKKPQTNLDIARPGPWPRGGYLSFLPGVVASGLLLAGAAACFGSDTPVTPNPSREAQSLLAYFHDIYGKKILSGQHEGERAKNGLGADVSYIRETTGKLPALLSLDFGGWTRYRDFAPLDRRHEVAECAMEWYSNRNGIVSLCWHWHVPIGRSAFYTKDTQFDAARAVTSGTPEHTAILSDIDAVAGELKLLRDAHVPVLWRPLHEANGRWFWWGAAGPEPFKKLWRLMFERLSVQHRLNNLIWVFSPGASIDLADWYPGDAYLDIIGQDHYPMDGNNGPAKDIFDELADLGRQTKLVGLSENGPIPDPERVASEKAGWLFFTTWSGTVLRQHNTKEQLRAAYHHPRVLNLDDLPNLRTYPFKPAGKAVKLGFYAPPADLAIGGSARLPLAVAVQDSAGRTVRAGQYRVSLALGNSSGHCTLAGTLSASTVNGVATFPGLSIDTAGDSFSLAASVPGLAGAVSPLFRVGPGTGIIREWWTNSPVARLVDLAELDVPPGGRDRFLKALEAPVSFSTNFLARFRGYLLPPLTGSYVFWLANDGVSELWLSTNSASTDKVKIAAVTTNTPYCKWPHTHEAESIPVRLEAGRACYFEVLQKQRAGSVHLSLRWQLPNGVQERPIPASRLASAVPPAQTSSHTTTSLNSK